MNANDSILKAYFSEQKRTTWSPIKLVPHYIALAPGGLEVNNPQTIKWLLEADDISVVFAVATTELWTALCGASDCTTSKKNIVRDHRRSLVSSPKTLIVSLFRLCGWVPECINGWHTCVCPKPNILKALLAVCWSPARQPPTCNCATVALSSSADCWKMPVLRTGFFFFFFLNVKDTLILSLALECYISPSFLSLSAETPMSHSRGTFWFPLLSPSVFFSRRFFWSNSLSPRMAPLWSTVIVTACIKTPLVSQ